ncbi:pep-cterm sorting domain-containing protein [Anaeramoeba ignava]|uniref:Pep-cterm sorting domain-containing protein n=1 Tax=Anaeramoeba ignava TaxID=1746090 RepID=A0A9Q0LF58_ANAIG|nr:pep-cterm sorting domain-containing protein [Anaeramoeba ignava]
MTQTFSSLEKLSLNLKELYDSKNFTDFEVICQTEKTTHFKCHKAILSTRNDFFRKFINSQTSSKMFLQNVKGEIFSIILEYFYTGNITISVENVSELLVFSSKYLIEEIGSFCSIYIRNHLEDNNVIPLLEFAESNHFNELTDLCYDYIKDNFATFSQSSQFFQLKEVQLTKILSSDFINAKEFDIFNAFIRWSKRKLNLKSTDERISSQEKDIIKQKFQNLIFKIRIIDFQDEEFENFESLNFIEKETLQSLSFLKSISPSNEKSYNLLQFYQKEAEKQGLLIFNPRALFKSEILKKSKYFGYLKEWINDNNFFDSLELGFSMKRDGSSCETFHTKADDKGKTLILVKLKNGCILGGFTYVGFKSGDSSWIKDDLAFIFTLKNPVKSSFKFPIQENETVNAICSYKDYGPIFGAGYDIEIRENMTKGSLNIGISYKTPDGFPYQSKELYSLFGGSYEMNIENIEVYFEKR